MDEQRYPKGWNAGRVKKVIEYYEAQTDEEAAAEIEAMFGVEEYVTMEVPKPLVSQVQALIDQYESD
ncbi:MAG TPA: hypothetical protein VHR66_11645 [Gemmataceae bacterium]|jgi:hypothetical protein|nr:hypothetical protein [Gemmataceae bacterium]